MYYLSKSYNLILPYPYPYSTLFLYLIFTHTFNLYDLSEYQSTQKYLLQKISSRKFPIQ